MVIWRCLIGFALSLGTVALTTRATLFVLRTLVLRRTLRQKHCPAQLTERHKKKVAIPAMGGVWLLVSQVVVFVILMDRGETASWLLLFTALTFGLIGLWDDVAKLRLRAKDELHSKNAPLMGGDLSARAKFCAQALSALALTAPLLISPDTEADRSLNQTPNFGPGLEKAGSSTVQVIQSKQPPPLTLRGPLSRSECARHFQVKFYMPWNRQPVFIARGWQVVLASAFFIFVVVGSSNAVNLADGLDGLASGCAICVSTALLAGALLSSNPSWAASTGLAYVPESAQVAIYLSGLAGGLGGFLLYNRHPARIFMGDVGSLSLGAILGLAALLMRQEWTLALSAGVFIAETLSVILQVLSCRWRGGKRIFLCSPLHHHFECLGWSEMRIVRTFVLCAFFLSAASLIILLKGRV